jgi:hypothetical protein
MSQYFDDGYTVKQLPSIAEKLREINSLLGILLGVDPESEGFLELVHDNLAHKFTNRDNYFGFLKAFTNSPIVQSISADPQLISLVRECGVQNPSLVTPPILHVVAKDLIADESKVFTPPHQDVISTKGSIGQVVVWIPLHDVFVDGYGISAIPGSHKLGTLQTDASGFGHTVKPSLIEGMQSKYLDLAFGDTVIFSQYLVHHTHTVGKFRMALSFRFNDISDVDWARRHYFVSFERVPVKSHFEDLRDQAPSDPMAYFSKTGKST